MASPSPPVSPPPTLPPVPPPPVSTLGLALVPETTLHRAIRFVPAPVPPVPSPPGNNPTKTSKPNTFYQNICKEKKKKKIAALLSSYDPRQVEESKAIKQEEKDKRKRYSSRKRKTVDLVQAIKPSSTITVSTSISSRATRSRNHRKGSAVVGEDRSINDAAKKFLTKCLRIIFQHLKELILYSEKHLICLYCMILFRLLVSLNQ